MNLGLTGKKALVTGASRGLGRAIALALSEEGVKVAVIARTEGDLKSLVELMGGAEAGHRYVVADLMSTEQTHKAVTELEGEGKFDIVVHNVGGSTEVRDPLSPWAEWNKTLYFNVGMHS